MKDSSRWIGWVLVVGSLFLSVMRLTDVQGGPWATMTPVSKALAVAALIVLPATFAARAGLWRLAVPGPGSRLLLASLLVALASGAVYFALPFTVSGHAQAWEPGGSLYGINYFVAPALAMLANLLTALGVFRAKLAPRWVAILGLASVALWVVSASGMALSRVLVSLEGVIVTGVLVVVAMQMASNGFYLALGIVLLRRPTSTSVLHGPAAGAGSGQAEVAPAATELALQADAFTVVAYRRG